jgi:HEAT repeat protein
MNTFFEALMKQLAHPDASVRSNAAWSLGELKDARAVEPLIAMLLGDKDDGVRIFAAFGLGKIGDARAVPALIAALDETDDNVLYAVAQALGKIGDDRAVEPLIAALKTLGNGRSLFRDAAVWALEQLGHASTQ